VHPAQARPKHQGSCVIDITICRPYRNALDLKRMEAGPLCWTLHVTCWFDWSDGASRLVVPSRGRQRSTHIILREKNSSYDLLRPDTLPLTKPASSIPADDSRASHALPFETRFVACAQAAAAPRQHAATVCILRISLDFCSCSRHHPCTHHAFSDHSTQRYGSY